MRPGAASSSTRSRRRPSTSSTAPAGSVGQVRESTLRLMEFAKGEGIAVVLVGHVTKDGSIAGPKTLEHLVDAVRRRSKASATRRSASCAPRRTASARPTRSACSRWPSDGLVEVADPARAFLADHAEPAAGQRRRADDGGQPAAARRGPGARRRRPATATPARDGERHRPEPARRCWSRCSAGGPAIGARVATTSTPTSPAA